MKSKNVLYINGCMRDNSRTNRLAQAYIEELKKYQNIQCESVVVDNLNILPMNNDDIKKRDIDIINKDFEKEEYIYAKQFAKADIIVISAPYWDMLFPSKLKVYFEHICVNNLTFKYDSEGHPVKICNADRIVYITTAGGYIRKHPSVQTHIEELGELFGISDVKFYVACGLDIDGASIDEILNASIDNMKSDIATIKTSQK